MSLVTIRGWIYILSNASMPGLVKVGFSLKDPTLRASELAGTGVPHPFLVEYEALVHAPRDLEQRVHRRLSKHREAKEFFRCNIYEAVQAIRAESTQVLLENLLNSPPNAPAIAEVEKIELARTLDSNPTAKTPTEINKNNNKLTEAKAAKDRKRLKFSAAYCGTCFSCNQPISQSANKRNRDTPRTRNSLPKLQQVQRSVPICSFAIWRAVRPNPSVKLSTNGGPPGPGRQYVVHFCHPGPGVPPLAPAYLER